MIRLNVTALTRLDLRGGARIRRAAHGHHHQYRVGGGAQPESLNGVYGASKAFVLALSHSLHHELADKGVRIQAVLPGATATDIWDKAGKPLHTLPAAILMSTEDMVDAALTGLDQGELVTIPALPDSADWDRFEAARRAMSGKLSNAVPAPRYTNKSSAQAPAVARA